MKKVLYYRDYPDGSKKRYEVIIEPPSAENQFYDDYIKNEKSVEPSLYFKYFGKERSYPERAIIDRRANAYIIHYVTGGKGKYNGSDVARGQGFVTYPSKAHTMIADRDDPWRFCWMSVNGREASKVIRDMIHTDENGLFEFEFFERLEEIFDDVIYSDHTDADMDTYMLGAFYMIAAHHKKPSTESPLGSGGSKSYVERAEKYIDEHYAQQIRVEEIADMMHVSRKYLSSIFRKYTGFSLKEYVIAKRIDAAAFMLSNTDMSVSSIAQAVGYDNYTQLSVIFKGKMGLSPCQYRKAKNESGAE